MKHKRSASISWLLIAIAITSSSVSNAAVIDPREIALGISSTLTDLDLLMIESQLASAPGSSLYYDSEITRSGWTGHLFGQHGGTSVDITYTGSINQLSSLGDSYSISYSSNWDIGGEKGVGSGSGQFTDPDGSFSISLSNLSVGGAVKVGYGIASLKIAGKKDFGQKLFEGSATAAVLDTPIGSLADATLTFRYFQYTGNVVSFTNATAGFGLLSRGVEIVNIGKAITESPDKTSQTDGMTVPSVCGQEWCNPTLDTYVAPVKYMGTVTVAQVPEASSLAMLIAGLGVAYASNSGLSSPHNRRRRARNATS